MNGRSARFPHSSHSTREETRVEILRSAEEEVFFFVTSLLVFNVGEEASRALDILLYLRYLSDLGIHRRVSTYRSTKRRKSIMNACYLADLFNRFTNRFIISWISYRPIYVADAGNRGCKIGDRDHRG